MKTHTHHIIPVSRGGSDDPKNLVVIDFVEHARHHAEDFLNGGPQFDFRHEGWPWLDEELRQKVLDKTSQKHMGNGGRFGGRDNGEPHPCEGLKWWNDGWVAVRAKECPGPGWGEGQLWNDDWTPTNDRTHNKGRKMWNNGTETRLCFECPGPEWKLGDLEERNHKKGRPGVPKPDEWKEKMSEMRQGNRNPCAGRRWVTDGQTNIYLKPGEETPENFKPGRTL